MPTRAADMPVAIASRRELFVDTYLIDRLEGARLQLQRPRPAGVALRFDRPWEGAFSGYTTVMKDANRYLMTYRGWPATENASTTCLAESDDGVHWSRPDLGRYEVLGNRENNLLLPPGDPATHNFSPFLDTRPGVGREERLKALGGGHGSGGLCAFASPDGVRWRKLRQEPVFQTEGAGLDSQNVAFWSEAEQCYVMYYRSLHALPNASSKHGVRWVSRCTSEDFVHWSEPAEMDAGDTPLEELYTQQTHPYFRAPHIYIALAARFQPGRRVVTDEQAAAAQVPEKWRSDCSDGVLITSRGGSRYDRTFMESFVRPDIGAGHWVSRANYPALGVVPTGPAEMSLYVNRRYTQPTAYLERLTLRTDGFASVNAPYAGGEMVTRPLVFQGGELEINVATSAAGTVRVEIQEETGHPVPGHALEDADEIIGDEIERAVTWRGRADAAALAGRPVRLRFVMKDADLFSLRFR